MSEALADQALLSSNGIKADLENSHDIHPSLIGQIFLTVPPEELNKALEILNIASSKGSDE